MNFEQSRSWEQRGVVPPRSATRSAVWLTRIAFASILASAVPVAAGAQQAVTAPLVFDSVTVIDVAQGKRLPAQRVIVVGNHIRVVGAARKVKVPPGARVVAAGGKYLIPGLWDMHLHMYGEPPQTFYSLLLANGITGIRDPAQFHPIDSVRRWRAEIAAGIRSGPRQLLTGGLLNTDSSRNRAGPPWIPLRSIPELRHAIDSLHEAGAEFVKAYTLSPQVFWAIASEAKRVGVRMEGHTADSVDMGAASDSGMRIFDHLAWMRMFGRRQGPCHGDSATLATCTALAQRLRRNHSWIEIGPTGGHNMPLRSRLPYIPDSRRNSPPPEPEKETARMLTLMQRAGMPLLSGTDASQLDYPHQLPGYLVHEELAFAVASGLTPLTALQTVTLNPARYLGGTDSLGTVARGKLADLVLLDADPLADITNTTAIRAVVANGHYFDRAALDSLLAEVQAAAKQP